jgi:hypothetical protein
VFHRFLVQTFKYCQNNKHGFFWRESKYSCCMLGWSMLSLHKSKFWTCQHVDIWLLLLNHWGFKCQLPTNTSFDFNLFQAQPSIQGRQTSQWIQCYRITQSSGERVCGILTGSLVSWAPDCKSVRLDRLYQNNCGLTLTTNTTWRGVS